MTVPVRRLDYSIDDIDRAYAAISETYAQVEPHLRERHGGPILAGSMAMSDVITIDRMLQDTSATSRVDPFDDLVSVCCLDGHLHVRVGGAEARVTAGNSWLYVPGEPAWVDWEPFRAVVVRLPWAVMTQAAAAAAGARSGELRFLGMNPVSRAAARLWHRTVTMAAAQLLAPDGVAHHELVHRELVGLVATVALATFPNTTWAQHDGPGGRR